MKILKQVQIEGEINHRNALFLGAVCSYGGGRMSKVIFSLSIQNPDDEPNPELAKTIALGRIKAAFNGTHGKHRLEKFTASMPIGFSRTYLISKGALHEMLKQFKRVKERDLADDIGLKWKPKEGDIVRELSIDTSQAIDSVGPIKANINESIDKTGASPAIEDSGSKV